MVRVYFVQCFYMGRKPGKAAITPAELKILQVLNQQGASTVREVHETIQKDQDVGYTSVLKTLQLMHGKGLVDRDESARSHTYSASESAHQSKRNWISNVMHSVFRGSASELLLHAVDPKTVTQRDIDELQKVVDQLREQSQQEQQ